MSEAAGKWQNLILRGIFTDAVMKRDLAVCMTQVSSGPPVSVGHDTVSSHWPAVRSGACVLHALSVQNYNKLLKSYNTDDQNRDVSVSCGWVWVCGVGVGV